MRWHYDSLTPRQRPGSRSGVSSGAYDSEAGVAILRARVCRGGWTFGGRAGGSKEVRTIRRMDVQSRGHERPTIFGRSKALILECGGKESNHGGVGGFEVHAYSSKSVLVVDRNSSPSNERRVGPRMHDQNLNKPFARLMLSRSSTNWVSGVVRKPAGTRGWWPSARAQKCKNVLVAESCMTAH